MTDVTLRQVLDALEKSKEPGANPYWLAKFEARSALYMRANAERLAEMERDAARLTYLAQDGCVEGFCQVEKDLYQFALDVAEENGREEPAGDDLTNGLRRLVDAAMTGTPGAW